MTDQTQETERTARARPDSLPVHLRSFRDPDPVSTSPAPGLRDQVRRVLRSKDSVVRTILARDTVATAVRRMNRLVIGSLVVIAEERPVGIFTERDVLTRVVAACVDPREVLVGDVMTRDMVTITPSSTVKNAMGIMTRMRLRHLPVLDGHSLVGLISAGDLTKWLLEDQEAQINNLLIYITRS